MPRQVPEHQKAEVFSISMSREYIGYLKEIARIHSLATGESTTFQSLIKEIVMEQFPMSIDTGIREQELDRMEDVAIDKMRKRRKSQGERRTITMKELQAAAEIPDDDDEEVDTAETAEDVEDDGSEEDDAEDEEE